MTKPKIFEEPGSESANLPFSKETIQSLQELGEVLRQIHNRLLSEGYTIKDGEIFKPGASEVNDDDFQ